jgi:guanyl-specific ribonuclease Sa
MNKFKRDVRRNLALWLAMLVMVLCTGCGGIEAYQTVPISEIPTAETTETALAETSAEFAESAETLETVASETDTAAEEYAVSSEPAASETAASETAASESAEKTALDVDGSYTSCEDVALYLETYGKLPGNFITKKEAQALGWEGGSLEPYAPGKCIGGDKFGNYEGILPKADGRTYKECDIDTLGADSRGAKRIVFSNDGLIYYTEDHYESFTLLYD